MNIIQNLENRFPLIRNDRIRDALFLVGMSLIVFVETMTTTMFEEHLTFYSYLKVLALVLIAAKFVLFDSWKLKDVIVFGIFGVISLLVRYYSTYNDVFFWVLLVWGARDIDFRKILKVHGTLVFLIVLTAFIASLTGKIVNLQYYTDGYVRNSFGIYYPTDFAAYVFFLTATFFYLMKDRMKWWMYLSGALLALFTYKYCHARLDSSCLVIISVLCMITALIEPHLKDKAMWLRVLLCFVIIVLFFVCFFIAYYYDPSIGWMKEIDTLFSVRLDLGHAAFERFDVNLFGQFVLMQGNGGSTEWKGNYFFLDSSYIYILFKYGVVFVILLLGSYVVSCFKRRKDLFFLVTICVIALNATTAHHLTHVQYNPFFMALLASFTDKTPSSSLIKNADENKVDACSKES